MKNQFTAKRLLFLAALTGLVFAFVAWQQTTNPPHGIEFTASRSQFTHYIPHVIVMALIVLGADAFVLRAAWKRYTRQKGSEPVTDAADARLNPLREPTPPASSGSA